MAVKNVILENTLTRFKFCAHNSLSLFRFCIQLGNLMLNRNSDVICILIKLTAHVKKKKKCIYCHEMFFHITQPYDIYF